jgi:3'(2'), 5'-bisphosphate nucleotidase
VDGTKGFIRREQYAVCLALIDADGQVDLAALACPNLPLSLAFNGIDPEGRGVVYYAVRGEGAYQVRHLLLHYYITMHNDFRPPFR